MDPAVAVPDYSTGFNWPAIISALVTVGSATSIAVGQPALGAIISDPHTAVLATAAVTGVSGLVSAFSKPVHALIAHVVAVVHH